MIKIEFWLKIEFSLLLSGSRKSLKITLEWKQICPKKLFWVYLLYMDIPYRFCRIPTCQFNILSRNFTYWNRKTRSPNICLFAFLGIPYRLCCILASSIFYQETPNIEIEILYSLNICLSSLSQDSKFRRSTLH